MMTRLSERVPQRLRRGPAPVHTGRHQLLAVERVALAAGVEPIDELRVGGLADYVGQRLGQLEPVERLQVDPPHLFQAVKLGQQRAHRVAAMQLVGPVAEEQHEPLAP